LVSFHPRIPRLATFVWARVPGFPHTARINDLEVLMLMTSARVILVAAVLFGSVAAATQTPATPVVPDTKAGKALTDFIESFNAGGEKRKAFLDERTTIAKETHANILGQDAKFLQTNGAMTLVRVPSSSADNITAILRFATGDLHVHLTLGLDTAVPDKISTMRLRPATPEEIKGGL
jgi:hypothetical protein